MRSAKIDYLRGISILLVLATHGLIPASAFWPLPEGPAGVVVGNGYYGVAMFFVVSGYLITSNALRRYGSLPEIHPGHFYGLRAARILPCLVLFLAAMTALFLLGIDGFVPQDHAVFWGGVRAALLFQFNSYYLSGGNIPGLYGMAPLWSLSIEETFYLVFPLLCFALRRTGVLVAVLVGLVLYGPVARLEWGGFYAWSGAADLLAFGCLSAIVARRGVPRSLYPWMRLAGAGVIVAIVGFFSILHYYTLTPSVLGLGAAVFLLGCSGEDRSGRGDPIRLKRFPFRLTRKARSVPPKGAPAHVPMNLIHASCVTRGLDPRVHPLRTKMDCRVAPGNDAESASISSKNTVASMFVAFLRERAVSTFPGNALSGALSAFGRLSYELYIFHNAFALLFAAELYALSLRLSSFLGAGQALAPVLFTGLNLAILLSFAAALSGLYSEPLNAAIRRRLRLGDAVDRPPRIVGAALTEQPHGEGIAV